MEGLKSITQISAGESQERLMFILQGADIGGWEWNVQTGDVRDNEHWLQMLGCEVEEIGTDKKHWAELFHPDDLLHMGKIFTAHIEGLTL